MDYAELNGTIAPFLSSASDVSQDWATAAIEIARDKRGRLEAAKMYLQRAEQIEKVTLRSFPEKPPLQPVWEAAFFCADAELLVNRNQAGTDSTKRDRSLREARRNAASGVYEFVWKNVLEAHGSFERLYQWSTRLRCASLDLVANNAERLNAVAAHRARMADLKKWVYSSDRHRSIDVEQATEFYCAEAEILFAKAKAKLDTE